MEYKEIYKYCPRCKADLKAETDWYICCTQCDFYFYVNPAPCNAAILENNTGEILLVKRKYDPKKDYWDVPGGFINTNESLEESMTREIKEELGIELSEFAYFASFSDRYMYKNIHYYTLGVVFIGKVGDQFLTPHDDVAEVKFFKKNQIPFDLIAFPSVQKALKLYLKK